MKTEDLQSYSGADTTLTLCGCYTYINVKKLSLCYSIVYYYNGAQRHEQFLQVG